MTAALNIKDPETCDLVVRIARHRGKSLTAAVRDLARREMDEIEAEKDREFDSWLARLAEARQAIEGEDPFVIERDRSVWPVKEW
jgi:hypothetical protein